MFVRKIAAVLLVSIFALGVTGFGGSPAFATTKANHLCEVGAPESDCIGSDSLSISSTVVEQATGRTIEFSVSSGSQGVLKFTGQSNRCVQATDFLDIVVGHCSGVNGIVFTRSKSGSDFLFMNVRFSKVRSEFLTGPGGRAAFLLAGRGNTGQKFVWK